MLKVTVKRSEWIRGEGADVSKLLTANSERMCCMGFACLSNGKITKDEIRHNATVRSLASGTMGSAPPRIIEAGLQLFFEDDWKSGMGHFAHGESIAHSIYRVNDDPTITDKEREAMLKDLGRRLDIEFTFVD